MLCTAPKPAPAWLARNWAFAWPSLIASAMPWRYTAVAALALAGGGARRSAEQVEEVGRHVRVRQLHGAQALRVAIELLRHTRRRADGVEQLLGAEPLKGVV